MQPYVTLTITITLITLTLITLSYQHAPNAAIRVAVNPVVAARAGRGKESAVTLEALSHTLGRLASRRAQVSVRVRVRATVRVRVRVRLN